MAKEKEKNPRIEGNEIDNYIAELQTQWEEMQLEELKNELIRYEEANDHLFKTLLLTRRANRAIIKALKEFISEREEDSGFDFD